VRGKGQERWPTTSGLRAKVTAPFFPPHPKTALTPELSGHLAIRHRRAHSTGISVDTGILGRPIAAHAGSIGPQGPKLDTPKLDTPKNCLAMHHEENMA